MKWNYKYMTEAQIAEVDELLVGDHGNAIVAFCKEIQNATLEGYGNGIAEACIKNFIKGAVTGTGIIVGIYATLSLAEYAVEKYKQVLNKPIYEVKEEENT